MSPVHLRGGFRDRNTTGACVTAPDGGGCEERPRQFPFSAVVGLDEVKLSLLLAAVDPAISGVLLRGDKGSAKTTLTRALASLLPGAAPFVELPVGATEDRVVGTLDLAAALTSGEHRFQPGLLAAAHGGVLYVDEVNLLPDHLVDVLLDVAASGINRVERDGMSHTHPSQFVLIGSMNPEEGELRPQLLDRFGMAVDVAAPWEPTVRAEAVRRRLAFDADPVGFATLWASTEGELAARLAAASPARLPDELLGQVSRLCALVGAQGLRADLTICRAAAALAGFEGRPSATAADVRRVAPLALAHRRRSNPFDSPGISDDELNQAMDDAMEPAPEGSPPDTPPAEGAPAEGAPTEGAPAEAAFAEGSPPDTPPVEGPPGEGGDASQPDGGRGTSARERVAAPEGPTPVVRLVAPSAGASVVAPAAGRRSTVEGPRGRLVSARVPEGPIRSLALGATVRAMAARQATEADQAAGLAGPTAAMAGATAAMAVPAATFAVPSADVTVSPADSADPHAADVTVSPADSADPADSAEPQGADGAPPAGRAAVLEADLREAVREQRAGNLIVLAVDASGSMGADRRMEAAKGAVISLLLDAYQRRDKVAVVTFRGDAAEVVLKPTSSVEVARARLAELPTGGRTPLAAGIRAAMDVATARGRSAVHQPLVVLITDGRATAGPPGCDPLAAARDAAETLRRRRVTAVVVDAEDGPTRLGLAQELATAMGARYLTLPELSARTIEAAVRAAWTPQL